MDTLGQQIIIPIIIVLGSAAVLLIIRAILFRILHQWATRTETQFDDIIVSSIKNPSLLLAVAIAGVVGVLMYGGPAMEDGASFVWSVDKTRWPVSDA